MSSPNEALIQRAKDIVEDCDFAVFALAIKAFPEVKTGDFSPDAGFELQQAIETALVRWLSWNHPDWKEDE